MSSGGKRKGIIKTNPATIILRATDWQQETIDDLSDSEVSKRTLRDKKKLVDERAREKQKEEERVYGKPDYTDKSDQKAKTSRKSGADREGSLKRIKLSEEQDDVWDREITTRAHQILNLLFKKYMDESHEKKEDFYRLVIKQLKFVCDLCCEGGEITEDQIIWRLLSVIDKLIKKMEAFFRENPSAIRKQKGEKRFSTAVLGWNIPFYESSRDRLNAIRNSIFEYIKSERPQK
jgi:hypothetical protein